MKRIVGLIWTTIFLIGFLPIGMGIDYQLVYVTDTLTLETDNIRPTYFFNASDTEENRERQSQENFNQFQVGTDLADLYPSNVDEGYADIPYNEYQDWAGVDDLTTWDGYNIAPEGFVPNYKNTTGIYDFSVREDTTPASTSVSIVDYDDHKDVLKLYDNNVNSGYYALTKLPIDDTVSDTIEFWIQTSDYTQNTYIEFEENDNNKFVFAIRSSSFQALGNGYEILQDCNSDQWYHIQLSFDCNTDTYTIYIDGILQEEDIIFNQNAEIINSITIRTHDGTVYSTYIDAVGFASDGYQSREFLITDGSGGDCSVSMTDITGYERVYDFYDNNASGVYRGDYDFTGIDTGSINLSFRSTDTHKNTYIYFAEGVNNKIILRIDYDVLYYYNQSSGLYRELAPLADNTWYDLDILLDCPTNSMRLWLDGNPLNDSINNYVLPYRYDASYLSQMRIISDNTDTNYHFYVKMNNISWAQVGGLNEYWDNHWFDIQYLYNSLDSIFDTDISQATVDYEGHADVWQLMDETSSESASIELRDNFGNEILNEFWICIDDDDTSVVDISIND